MIAVAVVAVLLWADKVQSRWRFYRKVARVAMVYEGTNREKVADAEQAMNAAEEELQRIIQKPGHGDEDVDVLKDKLDQCKDEKFLCGKFLIYWGTIKRLHRWGMPHPWVHITRDHFPPHPFDPTSPPPRTRTVPGGMLSPP